MLIMKCIFLFIALWFGSVNTLRIYGKQDIPAINLILQAIGMTGFIACQWLI